MITTSFKIKPERNAGRLLCWKLSLVGVVQCRVDVGSMWTWMENMYNKMRRRKEIIELRENIKVLIIGNIKLRGNIKTGEEGIKN